MKRDFTLNYKGEKQINLIIHIGANYRVSLCLTISSLGDILPQLIIFLYRNNNNREYPKKCEFCKRIITPQMIRLNYNGFNTESILHEYCDKIVITYYNEITIKPKNNKLVVIMDDAKFHGNQYLRKRFLDLDIGQSFNHLM